MEEKTQERLQAIEEKMGKMLTEVGESSSAAICG